MSKILSSDRICSTIAYASDALPCLSCQYSSIRLPLFVLSWETSDFNAAVRVRPGSDEKVHCELLSLQAPHTGLTPSHYIGCVSLSLLGQCEPEILDIIEAYSDFFSPTRLAGCEREFAALWHFSPLHFFK